MKHLILLFALVTLSTSSVVTAAPEESKGMVTKVIDGNTFEVQDVGTVRLADVICPDIGTQEGLAAKAFSEASLLNKLIYLDLDDKSGRDQGGRIICVAYLAGSDNALDVSKNFNKMIVNSGYAKVWDFTNNEFNPANWWGGSIPVGVLKTPDRLSNPTAPLRIEANVPGTDSRIQEKDVFTDATPPSILSFDFNPKAINTATSSQEITFTAHLTDDLSGIGKREDGSWITSSATFRSPSEKQTAYVDILGQDPISGTDLDGVYVTKMTLPKYSEQGTWKLVSIEFSDRIGNLKTLSHNNVVALGFPTEFQVTSNSDTTPPSILSFDFNPKAINTATSSQEITFTAHLTDDLGGIGKREDG